MGKYDPLDSFFADLEGDERRFSLDRFEEVTGVELPPSARSHPAWWSSAQYYSKWADHGWHAHPRLSQGEVVFTRGVPRLRQSEPPRSRSAEEALPAPPESDADLILIGCVGQRLPEPAPVRDLYTSPLWQKRRGYAEGTGKPWMVLSAEYGLLSPDEVVAPYDRELGSQPREYREQWSRTTAAAVIAAANGLGANTIEAHAGAAYLDSGLVEALQQAGLEVNRPLARFKIGEQLAWYGSSASSESRSESASESRGGLRVRGPADDRRPCSPDCRRLLERSPW